MDGKKAIYSVSELAFAYLLGGGVLRERTSMLAAVGCSTSSHLAAGISVVSVSSQAHSYESDGGDGRSYESGSASGSSWSLLSALQLDGCDASSSCIVYLGTARVGS